MHVEYEVDVPESRELRLVLPPDTPIARVRVIVDTVEPAGEVSRPTHPKLVREHNTFRTLLPSLLLDHPGKHVAIHDGQVIAVGDSSVAVLTAAAQTHPGAFPLVRLVSEQPPPPERLPSIRRPRGAA